MKKTCKCCKREIELWGNAQLCVNCRMYNRDLKERVRYYKDRNKKLNKEKYGMKDGRERIRWKIEGGS